jgi:hypothetical protein
MTASEIERTFLDLMCGLELPVYEAFDTRADVVYRPDLPALAVRSLVPADEVTPGFRITARPRGGGFLVILRRKGLGLDDRLAFRAGDPRALHEVVLRLIAVERGRWDRSPATRFR